MDPVNRRYDVFPISGLGRGDQAGIISHHVWWEEKVEEGKPVMTFVIAERGKRVAGGGCES